MTPVFTKKDKEAREEKLLLLEALQLLKQKTFDASYADLINYKKDLDLAEQDKAESKMERINVLMAKIRGEL